MPKSRIRRRIAFTPPPASSPTRCASAARRWLAPVMVACFVIGLLWVVVYYVTQTEYPIEQHRAVEHGIGFGLIIVGFGLSTRWK